MDTVPVTNEALGDEESTKNRVLETAAQMTQDLGPTKRICAHLNAFHAYASDPGRSVETNHYCAHLNEGSAPSLPPTSSRPLSKLKLTDPSTDVRQCILYDSTGPNARLIGIEYMITPRLFATLPETERRLWHSHVFEVKSGMLVMPRPSGMPSLAWEKAEKAEMEQVVHLYGKVYHLWQTDRGDALPLGEPQLMTSFTEDRQMDWKQTVGKRDERMGEDSARKKEVREYIEVPEVHADADTTWKGT
ncbi:MAG: hypothetical protein M1821_000179 [Bathelium mastoideum]|nr:MAG: hypothetical protein M1821_000179 [Bathelium mastoideum]